MSSNFLQRFKGKTQSISKDGVHNILGGNQQLYTNSNSVSVQQKANTSKTNSMNPKERKNATGMNKTSMSGKSEAAKKLARKQEAGSGNASKQSQNQNPFLISNPFYLDQEQRQRQQAEKKQMERMAKLEKAQRMNQTNISGSRKGGTSYSSQMRKSSRQKQKKSEKEWVKMGGLGPNIGGEEWEEKRKKKEKMQEFANQVKAINTSNSGLEGGTRSKPPKPIQKKDNPRTKALQYSKNIPKPVVKPQQDDLSDDQQQQDKGRQGEYYQSNMKKQNQQKTSIPEQQMSQLELYELKHKQLKERLRNQI